MADVVTSEYHWYRNRAGEWRQRADWASSPVPQFVSPREAALLDEIERLRAENDRLRTAGAALYALLDEMHKCGRRQPGLTEALEGWDAVVAATKENDRG